MSEEKELNIDSTVADIAADIGLGNDSTEGQETIETTETTAETSSTTDTQGDAPTKAVETEALQKTETAATPRPAPKAWAKEQHERWAKLDKDTQDYIEHREKQMLDGLSQYNDAAKQAKAWNEIVQPYMPLIQQQGVTPTQAVQFLFEAHKNLSSGTKEQRAAYLAGIAKSYGLELAPSGTSGEDEPQYAKELRERTERLERERQEELRQRYEETTQRVSSEVTSFADAKDEKGNPKHPYFDECHEDIVAYIKAGHTLEKAYEKAVYANPVTRAKELARLKTEEEAALRAKAKQEAEKSRNASRTNVNSRDTRRTPTAPTAKKWEDTLEETYKEIKERTTH